MAAFCTDREKEQVVEKLKELFGSRLDLDIIKAVAKAFNFDVNQSKNELLELANTWPYKQVQTANMPGSTSSPNYSPNHRSKKSIELQRVLKEINDGFKVLIILRGLPGAGKSTLAKSILENTIGYHQDNSHILSTDDFFMVNGCYQFDPTRLSEAHGWNHQRTFNVVSKGYSPVIIDNTNAQMYEMRPYASMASDFGYILEVLEPDTPWCFNEKELTKKNTHGVSKGSIRNMLDRYQRNVTPPKLLAAYDIKYKIQKPPQYRLHPPLQQNSSNQTKIQPEFNFKIPPPKKPVDFRSKKSQQSTSVDDLLNADSSLIQTPVLKPVYTTKIKQSSSLYESINLKTWGIDEQAVQSWDICTPLNVNEPGPAPIKIDDDEDIFVVKADMAIGTEDCDSRIIKNLLVIDPPEPYKVLTAYNRDINEGVPPKQPTICKKLMLHTSTMTEELDDHAADIDKLVTVFPKVTQKIIEYWYKKCNYNFEFTFELLLSTKPDVINSSVSDDEIQEDEQEIPTAVDSDSSSSSSGPTKNKRKNCNSSSSEESQGLKKYIESKVNINDDHYSDKLRRIRQTRYGVAETSTSPPKDMELEDFEFVEATSSSSNENDEILELNLGDYLVEQLEDKFAEPTLQYPKGFQPVIQIPIALARQIYTFYIESVYQQMEAQNVVMEAMQKEDEEFAKKLQEEEENIQPVVNEPVEIPDIMREQKHLSKCQKAADKWKDDTPDTLAARLTRDKLFNSFPSLDKDTLVEILHAHDNVYKDTVETLLINTNVVLNGDDEAFKQPPINTEMMDEMWAAHKNCQKEEEHNEAFTAQNYRDAASRYLDKRKMLYEKAQGYYQQGLIEVAQFYSALAAKQTRFYEIANGYAVTGFLDQHSKRLEDFNTLDLHYLYVKEALPTLDMFLDRNINLLRLSSTKKVEFLQIITGRGKNSKDGKPKIKPAVITRLAKRDIGYQDLNPGLLKIKITKQSKVTSEL
ncbi:unnamed protein product [Ceutorhynchus assimilis]|uniref:Smr domain-containing protein n=1 Tax=Ceutorhynchus assimilis TaxID=467358 RepID=A0A9N9MR22_9CUCU|nr:unnamed protein product [Ceutorhynchus assimilis]